MAEAAADLKRTPLFDLHVSLGGKMVPFAGYEMPVQYPSGIMQEHAAAGLGTRTTRNAAIIASEIPFRMVM